MSCHQTSVKHAVVVLVLSNGNVHLEILLSRLLYPNSCILMVKDPGNAAPVAKCAASYALIIIPGRTQSLAI